MKNEQDDWRMNEMKKISALFLALAMCVGIGVLGHFGL